MSDPHAEPSRGPVSDDAPVSRVEPRDVDALRGRVASALE